MAQTACLRLDGNDAVEYFEPAFSASDEGMWEWVGTEAIQEAYRLFGQGGGTPTEPAHGDAISSGGQTPMQTPTEPAPGGASSSGGQTSMQNFADLPPPPPPPLPPGSEYPPPPPPPLPRYAAQDLRNRWYELGGLTPAPLPAGRLAAPSRLTAVQLAQHYGDRAPWTAKDLSIRFNENDDGAIWVCLDIGIVTRAELECQQSSRNHPKLIKLCSSFSFPLLPSAGVCTT